MGKKSTDNFLTPIIKMSCVSDQLVTLLQTAYITNVFITGARVFNLSCTCGSTVSCVTCLSQGRQQLTVKEVGTLVVKESRTSEDGSHPLVFDLYHI